jgi:hypothetical protein
MTKKENEITHEKIKLQLKKRRKKEEMNLIQLKLEQ